MGGIWEDSRSCLVLDTVACRQQDNCYQDYLLEHDIQRSGSFSLIHTHQQRGQSYLCVSCCSVNIFPCIHLSHFRTWTDLICSSSIRHVTYILDCDRMVSHARQNIPTTGNRNTVTQAAGLIRINFNQTLHSTLCKSL